MSALDKVDKLVKQIETTNENITNKSNIIGMYGSFNEVKPKDVKLFCDASKNGNIFVRLIKNSINDIDRLFMLKSIKYLKDISLLKTDIKSDIESLKPTIIYSMDKDLINNDISLYCKNNGIKICGSNITTTEAKMDDVKNMDLTPNKQLTSLSNVVSLNELSIEQKNDMYPWRLCVFGGWLDQPFVSKIYPGSVIVVNVKFNKHFGYRSGLATSSREYGIKIWNGIKDNAKHLDNLNLAKLLFGAENPPGSTHISGSQDHLGLMLPGISRLDYNGEYWPYNIEQILSKDKIFKWFEKVLYIVPGRPRKKGYNPMSINNINKNNVKMLSDSAIKGWKAILNCDTKLLGEALRDNNTAWKDMLPLTVPDECGWKEVDKSTYGALVTHGGGYIMCASDKPVKNGFQIQISTDQWVPNSKELNPI